MSPLTSDEIRRWRKSLGLSQRKLAELLGLDPKSGHTVGRWESGKISPAGPVLKLLKIYRAASANDGTVCILEMRAKEL
jgi:DNA-binding transcriptional regulator YiaG